MKHIGPNPKCTQFLKQIRKDINETAKIQGNTDENLFLQY
jgi:hypothetical protein